MTGKVELVNVCEPVRLLSAAERFFDRVQDLDQ
jgi:hypothetical protein